MRPMLHHRATTIPWSPGWALVLEMYELGLAMFPRPFVARRPA